LSDAKHSLIKNNWISFIGFLNYNFRKFTYYWTASKKNILSCLNHIKKIKFMDKDISINTPYIHIENLVSLKKIFIFKNFFFEFVPEKGLLAHSAVPVMCCKLQVAS